MHALDDVAAIIEHSPDVLGIDGAREVWVAEVFALSCGRTDALKCPKTKLSS